MKDRLGEELLAAYQGQGSAVKRKEDMHRMAEYGIAAHWRYKEGRLDPSESDRNIVWLRQLLEWQQEVRDPRTFLTALKIDLYPDEVYIFTPKGEVMAFPRGATPLDFAYRIHTDLGHHCIGAIDDALQFPDGTFECVSINNATSVSSALAKSIRL